MVTEAQLNEELSDIERKIEANHQKTILINQQVTILTDKTQTIPSEHNDGILLDLALQLLTLDISDKILMKRLDNIHQRCISL